MAETIENPVINTPFEAPSRHFVFSDEGITSTIAQGRRALGSGVRVAYRPGTLLFVVGDRDLG
jgi:hypothetical protein